MIHANCRARFTADDFEFIVRSPADSIAAMLDAFTHTARAHRPHPTRAYRKLDLDAPQNAQPDLLP